MWFPHLKHIPLSPHFFLSCYLYFYWWDRLITFLKLGEVAFCRRHPMHPRNTLPSHHPVSGFPCGSADKESACNAGELGSIPGLGRFPGDAKCYPLQYSGLVNSMDCIVHGVAKSRTQLSDFHFHFLITKGPGASLSQGSVLLMFADNSVQLWDCGFLAHGVCPPTPSPNHHHSVRLVELCTGFLSGEAGAYPLIHGVESWLSGE